MSKSLTIIILTYNEEKNIGNCLDSVKDLDVPIYVVDSFSTDETLNILEQYEINYVQHEFEHYSAQRNWAQENNPFNTNWVFHLDAGEKFTKALKEWLINDFSNNDENVDGYMFSRRTEFMGKWIKYGGHYPNYHLRLFKVNKGRCENKVYDQHFVLEGLKKRLPSGIDIIDTVMDNLRDFTVSHAKWAVFEAIELIQFDLIKGEVQAKLTGNPIEQKRWLKNNIFQKAPLFTRSFLYFIYRYFIRFGFLDGKKGLVFHFLQGFWFRFLVDSNIIFIRQKLEEGFHLEQIAKDLGVGKLFNQLDVKNPT